MNTTRIITCCLLVVVSLWTVSAMAQAPASIFQLNGNPALDNTYGTCNYGSGPVTCDYWNLINQGGTSGSGRGHSAINTFVSGTASTESFTGGGSKDPNDLSQWAWSGNPTPNKDTLEAGYAAAYDVSDFDVVFGADRLSPNGDANIGIWFFQQSVCTGATGNFVVCGTSTVAHHVNGDILVLSAFTGGGGTSTVAVFKWDNACPSGVKNPQNGDCAASNLRQLFNSSSVCGSAAACGITNSGTVQASWASYSGGSIASPLFFEGGVDISSLFPGGSAPCFASFLEETRSSQSPTAVLKDFLLGGFPVCSMTITKNCGTAQVSGGGTSITYPVSGTVTNTGIGTLFDVQVIDTVAGTAKPAINIVNTTSGSAFVGTNNLAAGDSGTWSDSSSSTAASLSDSAYAIAAESSGAAQTLQSTNTASATCSLAVNTTLTVSKSCTTKLQVSGGAVSVQVTYSGQICNTGTAKVTNVSLTDYPDSSNTSGTGTQVVSNQTLNPANCSGGTCTPNCIPYGPLTYNPTLIDQTILGSDGIAGDGAGRYFFSDLIAITSATPAIGTLTTVTSTDPRTNGTYGYHTASCPICQGASECTP